jgi:biopolymer transport protein ExbD
MKAIEESKVIDEINVVPLLDLAWNLLIVFVIAVTAAVQGIKVDLPKASAAPSLSKPRTKAITIQANGQIFLDTYPVTIEDLEARLARLKSTTPDLPVVVKGDEKVVYGNVIKVLDVLQRLEITQLGLVTQRLVK